MFELDLRSSLLKCRAQFIAAQASGGPAIERFTATWSDLCQRLDAALRDDTLDSSTAAIALTMSRDVATLARHFQRVTAVGEDLRCTLSSQAGQLLRTVPSSPSDTTAKDSKAAQLAFAWIRPLLQFIMDHISAPYPDAETKQLLLEQCAAAGWTSVTQRKLEDWLNMARVKMGYTVILKSDAVNEDRQVMADFVHRVLFGGPTERNDIPPTLIRRIEMMRQWVLKQHESRAAKDQTSTWAHEVVDLVQRLGVPDDVGPDALHDEDELSDDSDSDSDSSEFSDSDTLYSSSDGEDDVSFSSTSVLGAKRKYSGLGLGEPPSRTVPRTSSNSSLSSHGTLIDLSDREVSAKNHATARSDDGHGSDRPAKRRRSSLDSSSDGLTSPTPTVVPQSPPAQTQVADQPYRSQKRKRSRPEDASESSPAKRLRQLDPPPATEVPATDIDALNLVCQLHWDASLPAAGLTVDFDWDDEFIAASPLDDDPYVDDLFDEDIADSEMASDTFVDTSFAWCKLQVYVLERMLRHGVHVVPSPGASPAGSTPSIMVDASLFNSEELAYLSSLSLQDLGVGQAYVEPPDLAEPGPNCPGVLRLSPWSADLSDPTPSDGTMLPSVDIDEWIASLLNEPFST